MTVKIHFRDEDKWFEGNPGDSLLDVALDAGVDLEHACGGFCACSTCHVRVEQGMELLTEMEECEEDLIDEARDSGLNSRLACQAKIKPGSAGEIQVHIPSWNINAVKEEG